MAETGMWPTPQAYKTTEPEEVVGMDAAKMFPMPTAVANMLAPSMQKWRSHRNLWATPKSRDWKGQSQRGIHAPMDALPNMDRGDGKPVGGKLNPMWVELLMGWPENWTCVEPISHVKYCQWLMENCHAKEIGTREVLRVLRFGHAAEEVSRAVGRHVGIREAAVLLSDVCQHMNRPDQFRFFMACAEALAGASYEPGHQGQPTGEHPDALQALSRLLAHYGKEAWQDGSWENTVPRVADVVDFRMDRLRCIGNGQVPAVVKLAWGILRGTM